jgi:hypothetical protein
MKRIKPKIIWYIAHLTFGTDSSHLGTEAKQMKVGVEIVVDDEL